jgi:hypothetical protein
VLSYECPTFTRAHACGARRTICTFKLQASRSSGYTNTSCRGCGSTWEVVRGHDVFDSKYSGEVLYHRHHMGILFPTTIMGPSMCLQ